RSPIGVGGLTRGISIQEAIVMASGQLGDVNEIDLQQLIKDQLGWSGATNFVIDIANFRGGQVVLKPQKGLKPDNATQADILWKDQASGKFYVVADIDPKAILQVAAPSPTRVWGYVSFALPDGTVHDVALRLDVDAGATPFTITGSVGAKVDS